MFTRKKAKLLPQIGISEDQEYYCCVRQLEQQIQTIWCKKSQLEDRLSTFIEQEWHIDDFQLISAIPYPFIWRKYLFFPLHYSPQAIYIQIIDYLKNHLPLAINEIFFDYQFEKFPEKEAIRVIVYALKKESAQKYILHSNTILDCELFCLVRGFQHYLKQENELAVYQIADQNHYVEFKFDELLITSKTPNSDYYRIEQLDLPQSVLNPSLYLTALGACLWSGKV